MSKNLLRKFIRNILAESNVSWVKPNIDDERGEIIRTAGEFGIDPGALLAAFGKGTLKELPDHVWERLENTDSWEIQNMDDARLLAAEYDRDIESIIAGIEAGSAMPAPIILQYDGNSYYLVGGNTRLMVAKALGIKPSVWVIKVK